MSSVPPKSNERNDPAGHWEKLDRRWWDPKVANCEMCGQMIPRDVWLSDDGHSFCSVECDELYRSYWLPRYGGEADRAKGG